MKKFLIAIALTLVFFSNAFAQEETTRVSNFSQKSKSLFLSYEEVTSKVYVGQIFPIKVKAIIAKEDFDNVINIFTESKSVDIINPDSKWQWASENTYHNTFYFKIKSTPLTMPTLTVNLLSNRETIESEKLILPNINVIQLKKDNLFSNVVADSLSVKKYKTTTFDNKNLIIVLEIEATNSNLKDFSLSSIQKNSVDSFVDNPPTQKIYYYAIIPNYQKTFEFTYFNIPTNKFVKSTLPVLIESDEVSTQLGLNPKESIFEFYKSIAYGVAAFLFFIIGIKRRSIFFLLVALLFLGLYFIDKNPLNDATLKANSNVMILPTEKSTVFLTTSKALQIEKLGERDNYIKVLLPDGKIGWTQNENIIKN